MTEYNRALCKRMCRKYSGHCLWPAWYYLMLHCPDQMCVNMAQTEDN